MFDPILVVPDWKKPYTRIPKEALLDPTVPPLDKCFLFLVLFWETQGKEARFGLARAGDQLGEGRSTIQRAIERLSSDEQAAWLVVQRGYGASTYTTSPTVSKNGGYRAPSAILLNPRLEPYEKIFLLILLNLGPKSLKKSDVQKWANISKGLTFRLFKDFGPDGWGVIAKKGDGYEVRDPKHWRLPKKRADRENKGTREKGSRLLAGNSSTAQENYDRVQDKKLSESIDDAKDKPA